MPLRIALLLLPISAAAHRLERHSCGSTLNGCL